MTPNLARLYREARTLHASATTVLMQVEQAIRTATDEKEMADTAYALREVAEFADDVRKRCEMQRRLAEKMACVLTVCVTQSADPIRTDYCTATPDVKPIVSVPKRATDPEGHARLMRYLGVPDHLWEGGDHAVVKAHFPGLVDFLAKEQQAGKPLPPGIDPNKVYQDYKLTIRGRRLPSGDTPVSEVTNCEAYANKTEEVPF